MRLCEIEVGTDCFGRNFDIDVKDSSIVAVQIFDQRKFKRKVGVGAIILH